MKTSIALPIGTALIALAAGAARADALATLSVPTRAETQSASPTAAEHLVLFHTFTIPPKLSWGRITIGLTPQNWRVGHVGGPVATESQLRMVLGRLDFIEIGGRCTGWVEGPTRYPCGIAVDGLGLAGSTAERFSAIAFDLDGPPGPERRLPGSDRPEFRASGLIAPVPDAPRPVAVQVPPRYLADRGATDGGKLVFRFRAVSNALVPSEFDRTSGHVMLCAVPDAVHAASAPGLAVAP